MNDAGFGDRLRRLRMDLGLSQQGLGDRLGHPQSKISNAERGGTPGVDLAAALCTHYPKLDSRWLLTGEGEMWAGDHEPPASRSPDQPDELYRLRLLAKRGSALGAWRAWQALAEVHPAGKSLPELAAALDVSLEDAEADLALLAAHGGVENRAGRFSALGGTMALRGPGDAAQHGLEALRLLGHAVIPVVTETPADARLLTYEVGIDEDAGPRAMKNLRDAVVSTIQAQAAEGEQGRRLRVVVGMVVDDGEGAE